MNTVLAIITGLTGAVIAIESLIMFIGVRYIASEGEQWICLKNDMLAMADIITGLGLIGFARMLTRFSGQVYAGGVLYALIAVCIITHGYREWEYFTGVENRFFFNAPLFAFNNIRLLGLVTTAALALSTTPE